MQQIRAERYLGKRIRLSAYIKSEGVDEWAGLWMRIDGYDGVMPSFDNMKNRPITGKTDWSRYEIVLDVPQTAAMVAFGLLLVGKGQVWLDDAVLEVVGNDCATTDLVSRELLQEPLEPEDEQSLAEYVKRLPDMLMKTPSEPVNLDFEVA